MPYHLRALVAILFLSTLAFWFLRKPLTTFAMAPEDYRRRVALWLGLTVLLFVSHGFWTFIFGTAFVLLTMGRKESNLLALYLFLLLMAPPVRTSIDGFAGITRFIDFDYLRLLSLVVLLPAALKIAASERPPLFSLPADKFLLGYIGLQIGIALTTSSFTDVLRTAVVLGIDIFLPYYAFSRGLWDAARMRDALAAFVGAGAVIAFIALFEAGKGWLLYSSLPEVLDVHWNYGSYMYREGSLRATVSTGHSIYLGYAMTAALGLHLALRPSFPTGKSWTIVFLLLLGAVVVSFARGPWVGAAAVLAAAAMLAPSAKTTIVRALGLAILVVPIVSLTPLGPKILSLLPFIGAADQGSVDYRQQLFTVSMGVLMMNPFFGSPYYMSTGAMESMRQGEGIIDMVNSYLGVALATGLVGLFLFAGVFISSALRIFVHLRRSPDKASEDHVTGRALLATLAGVLVTISTVGSDNVVPFVYWSLAGMCAAYMRIAAVSGYEQSADDRPREHSSAVASA